MTSPTTPVPPPAEPSQGFDLAAFITFRQMITPTLITVIYVIGFIGITIAALSQVSSNLVGAVIIWIVGQIYLRVVLELFIVLFRIYDTLTDISRRGRGL